MLEKAANILDTISKETDSIVLFHSLSGKDSIALMDLCYPRFKRVVCVFMYVVPGLRHLKRYISFLKTRYPDVEIIQTKHYALYNYENIGFMGCDVTEGQRQWRLRDIASMVCQAKGIEWSVYGFKQTDSLQRRLMLRGYDQNGIEWDMKKAYPLSEYTNKEVLAYIKAKNLKEPENYGDIARSIGTDIASPIYLRWLRDNYPDDYQRVLNKFPLCRTIIE